MRVSLLCLIVVLSVVAVSASPASSRLQSLKDRVLIQTEAGAEAEVSGGCEAQRGVCQSTSTCASKNFARGLCPGAADITCCLPPLPPAAPATGLDQIRNLAASSTCSAGIWDGSRLPKNYYKGMALAFAKSLCQPTRWDVQLITRTPAADTVKDALALYSKVFASKNMAGGTVALNLKKVYTLLMGVGAKESSGRYCVGRDTTAGFTEAPSAEAGPFQTSYGSSRTAPQLLNMFAAYQAAPAAKCFLNDWAPGVTCGRGDALTYGKGAGATWQVFTKACPMFATEWAAVLLRVHGGTGGEYGTTRQLVKNVAKAAEVRPACYDMYSQVETLIQQQPALCNLF